MNEVQVDNLLVRIYPDREQMGTAASAIAAQRLRSLLAVKDLVNIIFAAAPSQNEFLAALSQEAGIDWGRVQAFHMDEYIGLPDDAPQRFGNFLKEAIFTRVPFKEVYYLNGNAEDSQTECDRYTKLLQQYPADMVLMGIGENTHIAFNDPHVADFNDPHSVKVVDLDQECRQQQVNDGCFSTIAQVPTHALTLTVPALMRADYIFCMVPGSNKAQAIYHTLHGEINDHYPATALRKHPQAILFLDKDSAGMLERNPASSAAEV